MSAPVLANGRTGVFIDFSNLFWAVKRKNPITGERINYDIDFSKLHSFLKERHAPIFYNLYACQDMQPREEPYITKAAKHIKFLDFLDSAGYRVIRKDLKHIGEKAKCDVDVEITMDLYQHLKDIDKIILFSGDSDFLPILQYLELAGKHIHIYAFKNCLAWELKSLALKSLSCDFTFLDNQRDLLERKHKT